MWAGTAAVIKNEIFLYSVFKLLMALCLHIILKTNVFISAFKYIIIFLNIYNNSEIATKNPHFVDKYTETLKA